jgi:Bacterial regulatory proteins, tetR family
VATIAIPKKKTSSPNVKEKRKAGTRAGLTKAAIVTAAAELIESIGPNGFSLRKLAKALGVGPTTIRLSSLFLGAGLRRLLHRLLGGSSSRNRQ